MKKLLSTSEVTSDEKNFLVTTLASSMLKLDIYSKKGNAKFRGFYFSVRTLNPYNITQGKVL